MTTRMFTHTGPRRGDVFAELTFAKQIAMIEAELSFHRWSRSATSIRCAPVADVRDAVRAYYMLVTVNPMAWRLLQYRRPVHLHRSSEMLDTLISHIDLQAKSRSRSIPSVCGRSTPTCRCPIRRSSAPIPAGRRNSVREDDERPARVLA